MSMASMSYRAAIRAALREEMKRDNRVFLLGEDIGAAGGVFKVTETLFEEFGPKRVIDTPISEVAITGAALGAALTGLVPVLELMFSDFVEVAMDQIANQIARKAYLSGGEEKVGLVIRMASGGGISFGPQHSQSPEAWFAHTPGLITILPSCARDAKGLLKSAIRSGNPVMFFEHKLLYPVDGPVPEEEELIPIGKADVKNSGNDITLVSAGDSVNYCLEAAAKLSSDNVSAEVVDLRTLYPLDSKAVFDSLEKTGRVLIVEEDVGFCGWGAEVAAQISDKMVYSLKAPVKRVAAPYAPIPFSPALEKVYLPNTEKIYSAARALMEEA